jgi:glucokinase
MVLLGIDLGATKLASAIFSEDGELLFDTCLETGRCCCQVLLETIKKQIKWLVAGNKIRSIGVSVPRIIRSGTVLDSKYSGWTDYPLLSK